MNRFHGLLAVALALGLFTAGAAARPKRSEHAPMNQSPPYDVRIDGDVYQATFDTADAWRRDKGVVAAENDTLRLTGNPEGQATFVAFPHRRVGGNIVQRFRVRVADVMPGMSFTLAVNRFPAVRLRREGVRIDTEDHLRWTPGENAVAHLQDRDADTGWAPVPGKAFDVEFVHIDRYKALRIDGETVASRWIHTPWVCAEGEVVLSVKSASLVLEKYEIEETWWDTPAPAWARGELLFQDDCAGPESAANWVFERKYRHETFKPNFKDGWLRADRYSIIFSKERIDGPAIFTMEARPVPKAPDQPGSITDAIFLFHADWFNRPGAFFTRTHYHDALSQELQGYWFDFGGNANKTTRLRKWPFRHLMRQSIRPEDQLKPNHVHQVEVTCAEGLVEFKVDGRVLLRCIDSVPYDGGHFGILGFVRELDIRNVRVYRAVPPEE